MLYSRSREGAWIEIFNEYNLVVESLCRSREGAWIEIITSANSPGVGKVAPARERGLKSQWA